MEREARVWNGYSRITEIDWNDCLLQRSDWRLMITLGWREGRNGLGIKHQIGMEVEWKEWNGVQEVTMECVKEMGLGGGREMEIGGRK